MKRYLALVSVYLIFVYLFSYIPGYQVNFLLLLFLFSQQREIEKDEGIKDQMLQLLNRIGELEAALKYDPTARFDLSLSNIGQKRAILVKIFHDETGIAIYEANQRIVRSPEPILRSIEWGVASRMRGLMEMEGATVVIAPSRGAAS